jgi:hypothetical protein
MSLSNFNPGQELSSINFAGMIGGPLSAVVDAQSQAALATVDFIKTVGFTPDTEDDTTGEITPGKPVYVTFKFPKMVAPFVPKVSGLAETIAVGSGGTGYTVGDVLSFGAGGATAAVATVDGTGAIQTITPGNKGSGNSAGITPASGGSGAGATINISALSEIAAQPAVFEEMVLEVPILTMMPIPHIRVDYCEIDFHAKITSMEFRRTGTDFKASTGLVKRSNTSGSVSAGTGGLASLIGGKVKASARHSSSVELKVNASFQRSVKEGHKIDKTYQLGVKVRASQDEMPGGMEKILNILEDAIIAQPVN